jgi:hypothetical protein
VDRIITASPIDLTMLRLIDRGLADAPMKPDREIRREFVPITATRPSRT